ncbi:type IV pilus assembly protein PilM [Zobellella maritima]|uniref:type IV pilus assembly protein PilM n=1 Tax=Zobellella maritima TaxID=2059725 RepID=UPI000E2FFB1F|nr:type IV pilus assembly protein PilM [Zobellella maritima]
MLSLSKDKNTQWLVGIDFGTSHIKAVALKGRPGHYQLEAIGSVPTPKGSLVDHQIQDAEQIGVALKQLRRQLDCRYDKVATAVSGSSVITKVILVPRNLSVEELENQVLAEAEQHIPFPLDEISIDYESLGPDSALPEREDILLSAARTDNIGTRISALEEAGWQTKVVDIGVHALARAVKVCLDMEDPRVRVLALVDIGSECLTFAVMDGDEIIYNRLQNFGGAHFTRELAKISELSLEEVEQAKLNNGLPEVVRYDIEQQHINAILQHVRRNIQLFCSSSGKKAPQGLVLSGGGSLLPGLTDVLRQELGMPVIQPDFVSLFNGKESGGITGAAYMTALGLALRSYTPCPI